jgi:hypothetical protein
MTIRPGSRDLVWATVGGTIFIAVLLAIVHFYREPNPAEQSLFKAKRVELVARMSQTLASAAVAEKSAVSPRPLPNSSAVCFLRPWLRHRHCKYRRCSLHTSPRKATRRWTSWKLS